MKALALPAGSPHFIDRLLTLAETFRRSFLIRYRNWQQELDWNAKRTSELLMQSNRALALSRFKIGQVALGDTDLDSELNLCFSAPRAQRLHGIFACNQPIDHGLGHDNFLASGYCRTRVAHDSGRASIFPARQGGEPLVFVLRQNSELLAAGRLDELHFGHDDSSIVDLTTMPDGGDNRRVILDIENHPPVADAEPRSRTSLKSFHIAASGRSENLQLSLDPLPHIRRQTKPLPGGRACEGDLHKVLIANCYILVKHITKHDTEATP